MFLERLLIAALSSTGIALASCSDPSVAISFEIPDRYRARVAEISLQILVPPVAEQFDCDDLAFQEVAESAVVASRSQEARTSPTAHLDLRDIPRLGRKLFLVQGLDAEGVPVVAACREVEDIEEDVTLALQGEPVVVVTTGTLSPGRPLKPITVAVTDTDGAALSDIELRWMVTAPGGALSPESGITGQDGRLEITPPGDFLPGPVALQVSARWQRSHAPALIGFTPAPVLFQDELPGNVPDDASRTDALHQVGRIGPNGETGFAALEAAADTSGEGRRVYLAYRPFAPVDAPFHVVISEPLLNVYALGLAAGSGRDRVIAINGFQLVEIDPIDGSTTAAIMVPSPGSVARRILPAGGCGPGAISNDLLLVSFFNGSVGVYDASGQQVASELAEEPPTPYPIASGCVDDIGLEPHRTVVFAAEGFEQHLVALDEHDHARRGTWETYAVGVGFLPAIQESDVSSLLGPSITIEGNGIARYQLVVQGPDSLELELTSQDDAPTLFWSPQGGDVDGDRRPDVVALLDFGTTDGLTELRLLVSLGIEHRGQRLVGISAPITVLSPRLFLADFDYDGHDDILVTTPVSGTILQMGPGRSR